MKFLISNDIRTNHGLKGPLIFYLAVILCFVCLATFIENSLFGLFPTQIQSLVSGNPTLYIEPQTLETILIQIHIRLFFISTLYLILLAIYFRIGNKIGPHYLLPVVGFIFTIGDSLSLIAIYFIDPFFSYIKSICFFGQQFLFLTMALACLVYLLKGPPNNIVTEEPTLK